MDALEMEPIGKYKADRNGSAKAAAWRNMVDADLDDVAFLADSDKAREARSLRSAPVAVCSQRRALCLAAVVFSTLFAIALLLVYAAPSPDCPCMPDNTLIPGATPTDSEAAAAAANKDRIASNGLVFPWRGARLPTFVIPKAYSLWLHPNLTTGEMRGEVSIDFKVDRDTTFVVINQRDMNVTERALFKSGGAAGPKIARALDYPPADQTYIEFKDKLRRKYNYTLSLRFITRLERSAEQRGLFLAGNHKHRCAMSRFWLTHARSAFPCLDEPHFRASFKLTVVRDRFHVSLTNMPIVATEEAGFYLGHRLLQDEFAPSPPMSPHMMSIAVCRLQRRAAPSPPDATTEAADEKRVNEDRPKIVNQLPTKLPTKLPSVVTEAADGTTAYEDEPSPPPEISLYSDQQAILDDAGPLLEWVQKTISTYAYELNTSYPLPKLDIVVIEGGSPYSEGWGLIALSPAMLSDTKTISRLLAQQWFSGLVSPRWWSSQWLMSAVTTVLMQRAPAFNDEQRADLLLSHVLPALRLDSSSSARAVAAPRLEIADIEATTDELSIHKGAAIVSMAIEAVGEEAGRAALAHLLKVHRSASADARDLWKALARPGVPPSAWDGWCERAGYPLLTAHDRGPDRLITQERFVMAADPPDPEPGFDTSLLTADLRADLDEIFYEPETNLTEILEEDINATTTTTLPPPTTRRPAVKPTKPPPPPKWYIPLSFAVGPLKPEYAGKNLSETVNGTAANSTLGSRWAENVTHLVWMNDTEMLIPDLGKHQWVRYNVGARGLYRVAPQDPVEGESASLRHQRIAAHYGGGSAAERALALDDAFVLSRAGRLSAARAAQAAAELKSETHWAPWKVLLQQLAWWRALLRLSAAGPRLDAMLRETHPQSPRAPASSEHVWLSGALLTAGVEWGNQEVIQQALKLYDAWDKDNATIPDFYQEGAFTAAILTYGAPAFHRLWGALLGSLAAPRPLLHLPALLAALPAAADRWLFYRYAYTMLSPEAQRSSDWKVWVTSLFAGACRWHGASTTWRLLRASPPPPPAALAAAASCLHQPHDYYQFKELFGSLPGGQAALDTIALNAAWVRRAEPELLRHFNSTEYAGV
ncbi:uncharacterized protein LOC105397679 [Plutella xylostella]|uniref:uncharacterized protein LOC105397679 n=1 Tax=Plutella xylostella TaxID=51655 RepID=UPI0020326B72|nr:uncharacterized protein LOC105397679 [Plutella xylostella]